MALYLPLSEFKQLFPQFEVTKYKPINSTTVKIWSNYWTYIFVYKSSTEWSLHTLKNWQREMKGD